MGQSASQAAAFYREVAKQGYAFTLRDDGGYPAPMKSDGRRAQPFWSSKTRVARLAKVCPPYASFEVQEISWCDFVSVFVPSLKEAGLLVGVNWSGQGATGYDLEPEDVVANVEGWRARS